MCVRYSPAECAEYGCATKIGTLLYSISRAQAPPLLLLAVQVKITRAHEIAFVYTEILALLVQESPCEDSLRRGI